jgi:hypothetical protein
MIIDEFVGSDEHVLCSAYSCIHCFLFFVTNFPDGGRAQPSYGLSAVGFCSRIRPIGGPGFQIRRSFLNFRDGEESMAGGVGTRCERTPLIFSETFLPERTPSEKLRA